MNESIRTPSPLAKLVRGGASVLRGVAAVLLGLVALACGILFFVEVLDHIPDNAVVFVDETNTYYSPPLLWDDKRHFHVAMPVDQVRKLGLKRVSNTPATDLEWANVSEEFDVVWVNNQNKTWTEFRPSEGVCVVSTTKGAIKGQKEYSPDRAHVNDNGFYGKPQRMLFRLIGMRESRWEADGTWKW